MKLFLDVNQALLENLLHNYSENAKSLISKISEDKKYRNLSQFDRFNKRFKISWGMEIAFTDDLLITREDTRACYMLMLKISDLWFAFEHLVETASEVIPKDVNPHTKFNFYQENTLTELGFDSITSNFNKLMYGDLLHKEVQEREIYHILEYLQKNSKSKMKEMIKEAVSSIKKEKELHAKHMFSIAYGIRNIYVHEGVAAALGSGNYQIKRVFYSIVYDALVLYSLALGNSYCCKKLISLN